MKVDGLALGALLVLVGFELGLALAALLLDKLLDVVGSEK